jgi:hypothetical protein
VISAGLESAGSIVKKVPLLFCLAEIPPTALDPVSVRHGSQLNVYIHSSDKASTVKPFSSFHVNILIKWSTSHALHFLLDFINPGLISSLNRGHPLPGQQESALSPLFLTTLSVLPCPLPQEPGHTDSALYLLFVTFNGSSFFSPVYHNAFL